MKKIKSILTGLIIFVSSLLFYHCSEGKTTSPDNLKNHSKETVSTSIKIAEKIFQVIDVNYLEANNKLSTITGDSFGFTFAYAKAYSYQIRNILQNLNIHVKLESVAHLGISTVPLSNGQSKIKGVSVFSLVENNFYHQYFDYTPNGFVEDLKLQSISDRIPDNYIQMLHSYKVGFKKSTTLSMVQAFDFNSLIDNSLKPTRDIGDFEKAVVEIFQSPRDFALSLPDDKCLKCPSGNADGSYCETDTDGRTLCKVAGYNFETSITSDNSLLDILSVDNVYNLRDKFLSKSSFGKKYIGFYYSMDFLKDSYGIQIEPKDRKEAYSIAYGIFKKLYSDKGASNGNKIVIDSELKSRINALIHKYIGKTDNEVYQRILSEVKNDVSSLALKSKKQIKIKNEHGL